MPRFCVFTHTDGAGESPPATCVSVTWAGETPTTGAVGAASVSVTGNAVGAP